MINYIDVDYKKAPGKRLEIIRYKSTKTIGSIHIPVSIITPYYNTGDIFVETYNSVLNQSLQNWEWIIIDDGSPSVDAVNRLEVLSRSDPRIKVIRQVNSGTAAARNTGFKHSKGRYICLLDHDDMLEATYLEKCCWFLESNKAFAFCNTFNVFFGAENFLWTAGYNRRSDFLQTNSAPPLSVIRRSAWEDCGGFDGTINVLYEDWDFWLAMANKGHWGFTIPEYLQWYRKLETGRYEQLVKSGYKHEEFAASMRQKYPALNDQFPNPQLRIFQPFGGIELKSEIINTLVKSVTGRNVFFILPWMVTGGADRVNLELISGLIDAGNQVTVCATLKADHRWEYLYAELTPDVFVLPNFLFEGDYPRFINYLIESRHIDTVVVSGSTLGYQFLPLLRALHPIVAFVDLCHVEEPHWLNGGHPRFGIGYQSVLDLNVVTTAHLGKWMAGRDGDPARIRLMYTGVEGRDVHTLAAQRLTVRAEFGLPSDLPLIIFAGRICAQKRPLLLPEILKGLQEQGVRFRAFIIGEGELKSELEDAVKRLKLTSEVNVFGAVAHDRWLDILAGSDVFLMPSEYEGISIALLEAMAAGVVPVVSDVGGQGEIVSDFTGRLIKQGPNEVPGYISALSGLLLNPDERKALSKECQRVTASTFSKQTMNSNFAALLDEAHQLRIKSPRLEVSVAFGRELASQALEYQRVSAATHWLWSQTSLASASVPQIQNPHEQSPEQAQAIAALAIRLSQTWIGRQLTNNKTIRSLVKVFIKRFLPT